MDVACRKLGAAALYSAFGLALLYASGLAFVPLSIAIEAGGLPPPGSPAWTLVFPLQSLTSPGALRDVVAAGDATRLPWFAEAAPWFLIAVVLEVAIDAALMGGRLYALNDAVGSLALGLLSRVGGAAFAVPMAPTYSAVWDRWAVGGATSRTVWSWWAAFIMVDLGYWVFHWASQRDLVNGPRQPSCIVQRPSQFVKLVASGGAFTFTRLLRGHLSWTSAGVVAPDRRVA